MSSNNPSPTEDMRAVNEMSFEELRSSIVDSIEIISEVINDSAVFDRAFFGAVRTVSKAANDTKKKYPGDKQKLPAVAALQMIVLSSTMARYCTELSRRGAKFIIQENAKKGNN